MHIESLAWSEDHVLVHAFLRDPYFAAVREDRTADGKAQRHWTGIDTEQRAGLVFG